MSATMFSVPSPIAFANLVDESCREEAIPNENQAIMWYAEVELDLFNILYFLHVAQFGIEHRATADSRPRYPEHGGVLTSFPPSLHDHTRVSSIGNFLNRLSDEPHLARAAYKTRV